MRGEPSRSTFSFWVFCLRKNWRFKLLEDKRRERQKRRACTTFALKVHVNPFDAVFLSLFLDIIIIRIISISKPFLWLEKRLISHQGYSQRTLKGENYCSESDSSGSACLAYSGETGKLSRIIEWMAYFRWRWKENPKNVIPYKTGNGRGWPRKRIHGSLIVHYNLLHSHYNKDIKCSYTNRLFI